MEGRQGQGQAGPVTQTLDEAAADPTVSRGGWEGAAATQDVLPVASTSHRRSIDETADSLDSLMELTFDHLVWRCQAGQLQRAWAVMLSAFERTLLHTYRSKFTQFLVYYMCQQVWFLALQRGCKRETVGVAFANLFGCTRDTGICFMIVRQFSIPHLAAAHSALSRMYWIFSKPLSFLCNLAYVDICMNSEEECSCSVFVQCAYACQPA